jgi:hypothetical protein
MIVMGSLLDKRPDRKRNVLTEETLGDIGAGLETSPRKSLKRLEQETGVSRTSEGRATKLLNCDHVRHDPVARIHFL